MSTAKKNDRVSVTTVKPSELVTALNHLIQMNIDNARKGKKRRGIFTWGPPGIGKSSIVEQVCETLNFKLVDIRLTQMEPTDLRGIPVPIGMNSSNPDDVFVKWAIPALLPQRAPGKRVADLRRPQVDLHDADGHRNSLPERYDGAIILLDELPNAAPSVQAGSYQLVLDGRLGEYIVPDNCVVMAAGNRETDKGSTFKMPVPLMNRFIHLELDADFNDWHEHALLSGMSADVVGYLTFSKSELFNFQANTASRGFATPRSWETVSDILTRDPQMSENVLMAIISGAVGDGVAVKFLNYRKNARRLPNPSDILDGKVKTLKESDTSLHFALTTNLCYELRTRAENWKKDHATKEAKEAAEKAYFTAYDNFLGFIMGNFKPEMIIMGARTILGTFKLMVHPKHLTNWPTFSDKYQHLVLNA